MAFFALPWPSPAKPAAVVTFMVISEVLHEYLKSFLPIALKPCKVLHSLLQTLFHCRLEYFINCDTIRLERAIYES